MDRPIRLIEMLQLLGGRRSWRPAEIADRFGISERTAYRDLQDLSRLQSIPITRDEGGYRLVEGATIRWLGLTSTERATLKLLLQHPAFRTASELMSRLEGKLDAATRELEETPQALTLAGPERSGDIPKGLLPLLEQAVRERRPLSLLYRSLWSRQRTWRGLDPYAVFHRENTWVPGGGTVTCTTSRVRSVSIGSPRPGASAAPSSGRPSTSTPFLRETWGVYTAAGPCMRSSSTSTRHSRRSSSRGAHHPDERIEKLGQRRAAVPASPSRTSTRSPAGSWASPAPPRPWSRPPWSHGSPRSQVRRTNGTRPDEQRTKTGPRPQRDLPGMPTTGDKPSRQRDLI